MPKSDRATKQRRSPKTLRGQRSYANSPNRANTPPRALRSTHGSQSNLVQQAISAPEDLAQSARRSDSNAAELVTTFSQNPVALRTLFRSILFKITRRSLLINCDSRFCQIYRSQLQRSAYSTFLLWEYHSPGLYNL